MTGEDRRTGGQNLVAGTVLGMAKRVAPAAVAAFMAALLCGCSGGASDPPSAEKSVTTAEMLLPSPQNISASTDGPLANLAWSVPVSDVELTGYDVYVDQDRPVRLDAQATSFTSSPLGAGATHLIQVVALAGERASLPSTATVEMRGPATSSEESQVGSTTAGGADPGGLSAKPEPTAWCALARQSAENLTAYRRHKAASDTAGDTLSPDDKSGRIRARIAEMEKALSFGKQAQADLGRLGTTAPNDLRRAFDVVRDVTEDSVVLSDLAELATSKAEIVQYGASTCDTVLDLQGLLNL